MPARPLVEVAAGVLVATSVVYATTSTVLVGDDGACLLVDPGVTPEEFDALVGALDARGLRPAGRWCTHAHWDHVLTTAAWDGVPSWWGAAATVVDTAWRAAREAERDADDELATHSPDARRPDVLAHPPAAYPHDPREAARLEWPGPRTLVLGTAGHAPGHASLWLPDLGVLVAGDVLSDTEVPLLDLDAPDPVGSYRSTLDVLEACRAQVVVPGHGSVAGRHEATARIAADRAYLTELVAGRDPDDPRLTTPWLVAEHVRQRSAVVG